MPIIGATLNPGITGVKVGELHAELLTLGFVIVSGEQTEKKYGPSTVDAVHVFQKRVGLPDTGNVDKATGGIMALAVLTAVEGDREKLRRELGNAVDRVPNSPEYAYWLARYAIVAGDYQTAHNVARRFSDFAPIVAVIDPVLEVPHRGPSGPDVPYPENFYTYRHELLPQADLTQLRRGVSELTVDQYKLDNGIPAHFEISALELEDAKKDSSILLEAIEEWQDGIQDSINRQYGRAAIHYESCQRAVVRYFKEELALGVTGDLDRDLASVLDLLINSEAFKWSPLWGTIRWRRSLLSLKEIYENDWLYPRGTDETYSIAGKYVKIFFDFAGTLMSVPTPGGLKMMVETRVIAPLVLIAFIFVPLARAEDNRLRRQFDAALQEFDRLLALNNSLAPQYRLLCEFIEIPFIRLLKAETLLDQADGEYKARTPAAAPPAPDVTRFQSLKAAQTYLTVKDVFAEEEPAYVSNVDTAATRLTETIQQRLVAKDTTSQEFQLLGKAILVPALESVSPTLPGLDRRAKAHESLLRFKIPEGQTLRETNPRVYSALFTATAHLEQLKAGFNYLGYLDTYVPPWRFQFLLDRARYFAEHAKNAQREYLNFLGNAEREEFQELSASQNVEMEKSNVRIETARVDQVQLEVRAANESKILADDVSRNAGERSRDYVEMDEKIREKESDSLLASVIGGAISLGVGIYTGNVALGLAGFEAITTGAASQDASASIAQLQREHEKLNLQLAAQEARQSAVVAQFQLAAAQAGLVVAGLQRQAALLRHEFALQNLEFLRNRILNAEQWYRLAAAIRSISETYLRYAVELSFLAEQAYEFEADKRLNVIRFDYDLSEVGDFLAADFLMRDLDTLEQDLIVTQRQRQQQVRYVLSMAREFPEALEEIRDTGKTTFNLRLEQLEKRFPGLYNLRIGAVDVLPVALLDSTRFSMELTHLGTSQMRLKAQPDTPPGTPSSSPLNTNDLPVPAGGWLSDLQETWPVKLRVTGPETDVFSGLSRQEASAVFTFATTGQRHAFEALGVAAAWQVDFTARDNQIVPDSLADLLITFTLSGYHDSELRAAIDKVRPRMTALTSFLSARQIFPDAFYDFSRTGRMVWNVPRQMLTLTGDLGRLRNIGFSLRPGTPDVHFSRLMARLRVNFRIDGSGRDPTGVTILTAIPQISVTQTAPLTVAVRAARNTATELSWDFGDGTPILRTVRSGTTPLAPAEGTHTYAKPGRYVLKLRCVQTDSLSEFRISVVVSRDQKLGDPLVIWPRLAFDTTAKGLTITAAGVPQQAGRILLRVDDQTAEGNNATFKLKPGNYTLDFAAVRELNFRVYGAQRYLKDLAPLPLQGFSATTNRLFDPDGNEIHRGTPPQPVRNDLARRLFGPGEISPEDDWTFKLIPEEILGVPEGTVIGTEQLHLGEIQDVLLSMEYDITPGNP